MVEELDRRYVLYITHHFGFTLHNDGESDKYSRNDQPTRAPAKDLHGCVQATSASQKHSSDLASILNPCFGSDPSCQSYYCHFLFYSIFVIFHYTQISIFPAVHKFSSSNTKKEERVTTWSICEPRAHGIGDQIRIEKLDKL